VENFKKLKLDALIMIGGDGSMEIGLKLMKKVHHPYNSIFFHFSPPITSLLIFQGIPIVGVPKTIDNDLKATDVTFGFDTAVQNIVDGNSIFNFFIFF